MGGIGIWYPFLGILTHQGQFLSPKRGSQFSNFQNLEVRDLRPLYATFPLALIFLELILGFQNSLTSKSEVRDFWDLKNSCAQKLP